MGTAGVFGESNNSAIAGVIVLRGQDWKPVLSVAPDMDSYDVTPLDIKSPEGKKTFEDFLKWEAEVDGKKWADGKILKVSRLFPRAYRWISLQSCSISQGKKTDHSLHLNSSFFTVNDDENGTTFLERLDPVQDFSI